MQGIRLHLGAGADVNEVDNRGYTALMFVTETGNECPLKLLLKSGCDVNIGFKLWITPVLVAVERNFNNCVQLLIHPGANVNTKSSQGETLY